MSARTCVMYFDGVLNKENLLGCTVEVFMAQRWKIK